MTNMVQKNALLLCRTGASSLFFSLAPREGIRAMTLSGGMAMALSAARAAPGCTIPLPRTSRLWLLSSRASCVPVSNSSRLLLRGQGSRRWSAAAGGRAGKQRGQQAVAAAAAGAGTGGEASEDGDGRAGPEAGVFVAQDQRVVQVELHKEASESYVAYAMSVIVGRALPDVRDGLKPVHRRILFAMHELGLSSKKPFKKSARVVGEVLGKYHPHGDTAVYDALVRMAQGFSLRSPLINGHGNFGSIDADPAAAMRYTECRLEAVSESMLLADLEMDTVDFVNNFDESQQEPVVLPARLPNVLLNGASGIAVGMATNIPPHNLGEIADALCAFIRNPNATVQELMEYVPAPDFPTGGQILGTLGVVDAYRTGRGRLTLRGKAQIEQLDGRSGRSAVFITELPYQTNKAALVEQIADMVTNKTLEGVSDVRDESDRCGMRIVVEVKRGVVPQVVLNNLYKYTGLQTQFSCNMVTIWNGEPRTLGLREFLEAFLEFRCTTIERRTKFQLRRAEERDHLVQGFLIGLQRLDQAVAMIRSAKDAAGASQALQEQLGLSAVQAEGLLAMPLRRLTSLEKSKLEEEHEALAAEISSLKLVLTSRQRVLQMIEKEALQLKHDFGTPRRTIVYQGSDGQIDDIDVIANDETLVTLSARGYIKRMASDTFAAQNRGTSGKSGQKMRSDDYLSKFFVCRAHDYVLFFSERGVVYSLRAYQIPECSRTAIGSPLVQILAVPPGERITSILSVSEFREDQYLVMLTTGGCIKRTSLSSFGAIRTSGIVAMQLEPGDELRWVRQAAEDDIIVMGSQRGQVVEWRCSKLRPLRRPTKGQGAMRLKEGDRMAALDIVPASYLSKGQDETEKTGSPTGPPWLLLVTANGFGKRVPLGAFSEGGKVGTIGMKFGDGDYLVGLFVVGEKLTDDGESDEQVVLGSQSGIINRLRVRDISIQGRKSKGVKLMRLEAGDMVKSISIAVNTNLDETDGFVESELNEVV